MVPTSSKDATLVLVPTHTHTHKQNTANHNQHGTRTRTKRKEQQTYYELNKNKEKQGLTELMFSGDGQGESTKHKPWDTKLWDTPQNLVFVDLRLVLCSLFCGAFV